MVCYANCYHWRVAYTYNAYSVLCPIPYCPNACLQSPSQSSRSLNVSGFELPPSTTIRTNHVYAQKEEFDIVWGTASQCQSHFIVTSWEEWGQSKRVRGEELIIPKMSGSTFRRSEVAQVLRNQPGTHTSGFHVLTTIRWCTHWILYPWRSKLPMCRQTLGINMLMQMPWGLQ